MSLHNLLEAVATDLGVPELRLSPGGVCQIIVDGDLAVSIEDAPLEQAAHLYSSVANVPETRREEFYAALLEAQLFGREIGDGCVFGLEPSSGELLLCRKLNLANVEPAEFSDALGEFINWAEHWRTKLAAFEKDGKDSQSAGGDSSFDRDFIRA